MKRLDGKVAIVTGATGGIGQAAARRFIEEGARVALAARSVDRASALAGELGPNALPVLFDLSDEDTIEAAVSATVAHFGGLDILFNNAGATDRRLHSADRTLTDTPLEIWDEVLSTNLRSTMLACRYAVPHLSKSGAGSIINNASGSGLAGDTVRIAYGISKGGLVTLTKYIATQYGRQGIRCNAIAPGLIMVDKMQREEARPLAELIARHVVMPRLGRPEDIAALAGFLASDDAGYITGQTICCDGGMHIHQPQYADISDLAEQAAPGIEPNLAFQRQATKD